MSRLYIKLFIPCNAQFSCVAYRYKQITSSVYSEAIERSNDICAKGAGSGSFANFRTLVRSR